MLKKIFFFTFGILFLIGALLFSIWIAAHTPEIFTGPADTKVVHDNHAALCVAGALGCATLGYLLLKKLRKQPN